MELGTSSSFGMNDKIVKYGSGVARHSGKLEFVTSAPNYQSQ